MSDPVIIAALVVLAALIEASPRRFIPIGAVLAVGVVLSDQRNGGVTLAAFAGAVGVALASLGAALEARRGRDRHQPSPFAQAQRDALRARLSSSGTFARISFVMAALPGPTAKLLYPLLGAMRAPLLPALVGTIIGRTVTLTITTGLFTLIARMVSVNDAGAAQFLIVGIVFFTLWRLVNWIDWAHRSKHGRWRFRESGADPLSARMFMSDAAAGGFGTSARHPGAGASEIADPELEGDIVEGDIVEGDIVGEEILDDDVDQSSSTSSDVPRGS